ncbi:hypothetical protein FOA52_000302 [Chlamydomonas sp. UWO 241]|nr:hypothetical protein FOA52_000302 [Chlamydomonas sp. UWO 241]
MPLESTSTSGSRQVAASARGNKNDRRSDGSSSGFGVNKQDGSWRVSYGESKVVIPENTVVLGGLALLGLGAVIGPILIGLIVSAISIGVTVSIGAFAISTMFLPLAIFSLFFFLTFGGMFGGVALMGLGVFVPKVLSLLVTGAGLSLGFFAMQALLPKPAGKASTLDAASDSTRGTTSTTIEGDPISKGGKGKVRDEEAEEAARLAAELRAFDDLLMEREREAREERWRKERTR